MPTFKPMTTFQLDKCFDAIKQVGTANSAGLFGGAVALFYFKDRSASVLSQIKFATGIYLFGVLLFAAAYQGFILYIIKADPKPDGFFEHNDYFNYSIYMISLSLGAWVASTFTAAYVLYLL